LVMWESRQFTWLLHRLHMVDWAESGTSSSAAHLKQAMRLVSRGDCRGGAAGRRTSCTRKCWWHCLQTEE